VVKRAFDIVVAALLLPVYPIVRLLHRPANARGIAWFILLLPQVFLGRISLVGRPLEDPDASGPSPTGERLQSYLGPKGITGLVQINRRDDLAEEEIERYKLYYAKNQSLMLDVEILLKALLRSSRK